MVLAPKKRHICRNSLSYPTIPIVGNRKNHSTRTWKTGQKWKFEGLVWHRVVFWIITFSTKQVLIIQNKTLWIYNWKVFDISGFVLGKFWVFFGINLLREDDIFCKFCAFAKSMFFNYEFWNVSDFDLKLLQHFGCWIEKFVLWSDFELKIFHLSQC